MKSQYLFTLAIVALLLGCSNENTIVNEYVDIPNSKFSFLDTVNFQVQINDTVNPHDVFLQLRTSTDYKWSNMFIFSDIDVSQHGKSRVIPFKYLLLIKKVIGME